MGQSHTFDGAEVKKVSRNVMQKIILIQQFSQQFSQSPVLVTGLQGRALGRLPRRLLLLPLLLAWALLASMPCQAGKICDSVVKNEPLRGSLPVWQSGGGDWSALFQEIGVTDFKPALSEASLFKQHPALRDHPQDLQYFRKSQAKTDLGAANPPEPAQLVSRPFLTPAYLQLATLGSLEHGFPEAELESQQALFLERVQSGDVSLEGRANSAEALPGNLPQGGAHRLALFVINGPDAGWTLQHWHLPSEWQGVPARFVLIARAPELLLGVGVPAQLSFLEVLGFQWLNLGFLPHWLFFSFLLLAPGLLIRAWVAERWKMEDCLQFFVVCCGSACVAYGFFFFFFLAPRTANIVMVMWNGYLLATAFMLLRKGDLRKFFPPCLQPHVLLFLGTSLFYLSIVYGWQDFYGFSESWMINRRFLTDLPSDNGLPFGLAEKLFAGVDPRDMGGSWRSSDRPPLQAGFLLSHFCFLRHISLFGHSDDVVRRQVLQTLLQCLIVPAQLAFLQALSWPRRAVQFALALSLFSGTFLLNATFTWPKLLASALTLGFLSAVFRLRAHATQESAERSSAEITPVIVLGVFSAGFGFLSHSGVIFTLLPALLPAVVVAYRRMSLKQGLAAVALLLALGAPWKAYQSFYDPPGDRLVKMHLAGVDPIVAESALQAIRKSYQQLSWAQIWHNKQENLLQIISLAQEAAQLQSGWASLSGGFFECHMIREAEFFGVISALGVCNLGWLVALFAAVQALVSEFKSLAAGSLLVAPKRSCLLPPQSGWLVGLSALSLLLWIVLMFNPRSTVPHQGSYATLALLFLFLGGCLAQLPGRLPHLVLGVAVSFFFKVWVFDTPLRQEGVLRGLLCWPVAFVGGVAFCWLLFLLFYSRQLAENPQKRPLSASL